MAESRFFSSLKMRNGTFKLTQPCRFAALEAEFRSVIAERAAHFRHVLDVGVSTGLTTIELADFLRAQGASARVVGTDLFVQAHLVESPPDLECLRMPRGGRCNTMWPGRPIRRLDPKAGLRHADGCAAAFRPFRAAPAAAAHDRRRTKPSGTDGDHRAWRKGISSSSRTTSSSRHHVSSAGLTSSAPPTSSI